MDNYILEKYPFIFENVIDNNCIILTNAINYNNINNINNNNDINYDNNGHGANIIENSLIISKNNLNTALARKPVIQEFPNINLPFPPVIKAKDFIDPDTNLANTSSTNCEAATVNTNTTAIHKSSKKKTNKLTTKAPNKFFIYRKAWVMELRERGFQYPMTEISGFIAKKWQEETPERKNAYVKIAMEAKTLHKQKFGDKIKYNNNNDFTSASSQPKKTIKKKSKVNNISNNKKLKKSSSQLYIHNNNNNNNNTTNNNNNILSSQSPLNIVPSSTSSSLLYNPQSSSPLMFLHNSSNISYFSPQISPSTPINQINQFSQFKQPMVSLHNHTTIPSSSLILPTPGTTPTLPTPMASPKISQSSSYIDDNYFNEFINIDNNTTITSNNNSEENLPCNYDSPSTVRSDDLDEIDPDLFTFLI